MTHNDIIKSAVFGHIVGDALGVPVEFVSRDKLDQNPVECMLGNGSHRVPKGTWSDDSSMVLCTMASIIEKQKIDYDDMMERFLMWVRDGYMTPYGRAFGIGRATLMAINTYAGGTAALSCGCSRERDNGNGSLMRILPVVLYNVLMDPESSFEEKMERIHLTSSLTHAHSRSLIGCGIYFLVIGALIQTGTKESMRQALEAACEYYKDETELATYQRMLSPTFFDISRDEILSDGHIVSSLEAALWCVYHSNSYSETVLKAVNLGGDTDTIAAIAGALAGILYGFDEIPKEWVEDTVEMELVLKLCEKFAGVV